MSKEKVEGETGDDGGKGAASDSGGAVTLEQIRDVVREEVPKIVDDLLGGDADGGGDGADGGAASATGTPASNRAVEASVASQVRDELARVKDSETLHKRVEQVEEKLVEKPPVKRSWIQRLLWGDDE